MHDLGGDGGRYAVSHRTAGRAELTAGATVLQEAVRPAAEIAGVAGDDRVVGKALAQPGHNLAEIEFRRVLYPVRRKRGLGIRSNIPPPLAPARRRNRFER